MPGTRAESWRVICSGMMAGSYESRIVASARFRCLTWIVERSFAWLGRNRRLCKDYEYKGEDVRDVDRHRHYPIYAEQDRTVTRLLAHPLSLRTVDGLTW